MHNRLFTIQNIQRRKFQLNKQQKCEQKRNTIYRIKQKNTKRARARKKKKHTLLSHLREHADSVHHLSFHVPSSSFVFLFSFFFYDQSRSGSSAGATMVHMYTAMVSHEDTIFTHTDMLPESTTLLIHIKSKCQNNHSKKK